MTVSRRHSGTVAVGVAGTALRERLDKICDADWNFADAKTQQGVHGIHSYPAKFIPQIPRQLIALLHPMDGSAVLDPFCGSGTTLVEAQVAGHQAVGIDLNPIATLIARVKTHPPAQRLLPLAAELVRDAARRHEPIPPIPRLNHWFEQDVQRALSGLVATIADVSDPSTRQALQVALSSIIVRVSNQDGDTRYAAVRKNVSAKTVYDLFKRAAETIDRAHSANSGSLFPQRLPPVKIITKDILLATPADIGVEVGLVITSPPYPNAYEYWLYHKYRMYWLGMDPIAVRSAEIGARPHFFKKDCHTEVDFERQMSKCFRLLASVMNPAALACFLVGRSVIHGKTVDNAALLERAASVVGFRRLLTVERAIPRTRKAFNPAHGAINFESLVVFGR